MNILSHETKGSLRGRKPDDGETSLRYALRFSSQELRRDLASIGWQEQDTEAA